MDGLPDPADHRDRLAEVDLGVTRGMDEGNEHLPRSGLLLADVVLYGGVAARIGVLVTQALVDPAWPCGVAWTARRGPLPEYDQ